MIKIRIRNDNHKIDLQFPINENDLYAKLAEIHAIEGKDAPQSAFVTEVYWPKEFSMLKDRFANLDELNYLAKRMESFDYHEYDQFLIGITKLETPTEKDLINLTFNLDHFTLCKDVSSYGKISREYVMNVSMKINAIIKSKDGGTLVLDFPRDIYDVYEKLQSVGIRQSPHRIALSDEECDDVRVKLYSEDEIGKHLLLTLSERDSLADANMLAFMVDNAKPDFRSKLEQNLLHDQYDSM